MTSVHPTGQLPPYQQLYDHVRLLSIEIMCRNKYERPMNSGYDSAKYRERFILLAKAIEKLGKALVKQHRQHRVDDECATIELMKSTLEEFGAYLLTLPIEASKALSAAYANNFEAIIRGIQRLAEAYAEGKETTPFWNRMKEVESIPTDDLEMTRKIWKIYIDQFEDAQNDVRDVLANAEAASLVCRKIEDVLHHFRELDDSPPEEQARLMASEESVHAPMSPSHYAVARDSAKFLRSVKRFLKRVNREFLGSRAANLLSINSLDTIAEAIQGLIEYGDEIACALVPVDLSTISVYVQDSAQLTHKVAEIIRSHDFCKEWLDLAQHKVELAAFRIAERVPRR